MAKDVDAKLRELFLSKKEPVKAEEEAAVTE
jgi:hypothetical protein